MLPKETQKIALIIIDLQNDFLEDNHFSDKRGGDMEFTRSILPNIEKLCKIFRQKQYPIVWIHSIYGELMESQISLSPDLFTPLSDLKEKIPLNNELLSGTHRQGQLTCCARNTTGIQFYKDVIQMQDKERDQFIQKQYYSAFRETELLKYLKDKSITDVAICGVATNYCCRAASVDAFHLGFNVYMVEDCLAASRLKSHHTTLEQIGTQNIQILKSQNLIEKLS